MPTKFDCQRAESVDESRQQLNGVLNPTPSQFSNKTIIGMQGCVSLKCSLQY